MINTSISELKKKLKQYILLYTKVIIRACSALIWVRPCSYHSFPKNAVSVFSQTNQSHELWEFFPSMLVKRPFLWVFSISIIEIIKCCKKCLLKRLVMNHYKNERWHFVNDSKAFQYFCMHTKVSFKMSTF